MKFTILILIFSLVQVSAATFGQKITLNENSISIDKALREVRKQTGFGLIYKKSDFDLNKKVVATFKESTIETVLDYLLINTNMTYILHDGNIILKQKENSFLEDILSYFKEIDVVGKVTGEDGSPLPGANIKVKGTTIFTTTDKNGEFTLKRISDDALLVISFVGYESSEVKAGNILTVRLKIATAALQEVDIVMVNSGYQTIARERSAGSVAKPDMKIYNDRVGTMNVIQRLDGLIPGLTVNNAPGADQFQVRGLTTVGPSINIGGFLTPTSNRSPLFVVDGLPYEDINLLNPNDVADVTVLKDATAASIWGTRAANGVIVITTKSGSKGRQTPQIEYNTFAQFQKRPDLTYLPVLKSADYIQAARETFDPVLVPWATINGGTAPFVAPHELALYNVSRGLISQAAADAKLDSLSRLSNLDQMSDLFYENSFTTNHSLSVSGGMDRYSYYGSLNYTGNTGQGNRPDNTSNNFKLNLRQDFTLNKNISLYLVSDISNNLSSGRPIQPYDPRFTPYQLFQDQNGNNLDLSWQYMTDEVRAIVENRGKIGLAYVPVNENTYGYSKSNALAVRLNSGVRINLFKDLRFEGTYGYNRAKNDSRRFDDEKAFSVRREVLTYAVYTPATGAVNYLMPTTGGKLNTVVGSREDWTIRNQFSYNKNFNGDVHQLSLLAGNEIQSSSFVNTTQNIRGFSDQRNSAQPVDYKTLNAGTISGVLYPTTGGFSNYGLDMLFVQNTDSRVLSYYSNLNYTFLEKYGLNASWRIDQSNLFGKDKSAQNKPVWSVGVVWNVKRENWFTDFALINDLRLRATYGITGNSPSPGTSSSVDILQANVPFGYTVDGGLIYTIVSPANRRLTWELTKNQNFGLDFGILKSRISGSFDLYFKKTEGLLNSMLTNPFASFSGGTVFGNSGVLSNRGVELSLTAFPVKTTNFSWRMLINGAHNTNKITKSYSTPITTGSGRISAAVVEGYSAYPLFAYDFQGLDALGDPLVKLNNGQIVKTPNLPRATDVLYMGTTQPKWSGSFNNSFQYKAFDLQINMIFNAGHLMRRDANQRYTGVNAQSNNFHSDFANRWKKVGDEFVTDVPSFVAVSGTNSSRRSISYYTLGDNNVLDASFAKIRDLTLSYNLPLALIQKAKIERLRIFGQLGNVMVWKANKYGIDPEFQRANGGRSLRTGQHTISVGTNVSF